jgi:hypothetical protein
MNKKANKKNIARRFLVAGFFVLLVFVSLLDSSPAEAVVNDYYKNATSTLTATEWNNLLLDFLNTGGGRVNGSVGINTATSSSYILNVSGGGYFSQPVVVGTPTDVSHAATMGYINSVITGGSGSTVGYWAMNGTNINNTNAGNVGIGTTAPTTKLQVGSGNSSPWGLTTSVDNNYSIFGTDSALGGIRIVGGSYGNVSQTYLDLSNASAKNLSVNTGFRITAGTGSGIVTDNNYLSFSALALNDVAGTKSYATAELMRLNSNGNLGVGTTNPLGKFQIGNPTGATGNSYGSAANIFAATAVGKATLELFSTDAAAVDKGGSILFGGETGQAVSTYPFAKILGAKESGGTYNGYLAFFTTPTGSNVDTERMRINSLGNVGVGTTAASVKLTVGGNIQILNTSVWGATSTTIGSLQWQSAVRNEPASFANIEAITDSTYYYKGHLVFKTNDSDGSNPASPPTEKMRILGNGNVGIGNTAPGTKLDVTGSFRNSLATTHTLLGSAGNVVVMADNTGTLYSTPLATFVSSNSLDLWEGAKNGNIWNGDAGAGNVGIGRTNPTQKLHVEGVSATEAQFLSYEVNAPQIVLNHSSAGWGLIQNDAAGKWSLGYNGTTAFDTLGTSVLTWTNGGNVGIGNTNPGAKLDITGTEAHVSGDLTGADGILRLYNNLGSDVAEKGSVITFEDNYLGVNRTTRAAIKGGTATAGNTADGFLSFYTDSGSANTMQERMRIIQNGNVGIGITNPSTKLDIVGSFRDSLATTHTLLGGAGNVVVMADNTGTLYSTSTASFIAGNSLDLWKGTKNGNIWNGDAGAGNVGIGTTTPGYKLTVYNPTYGAGFIDFNTSPASVAMGSASSALSLWSNGAQRMLIDTAGNVGIGTTNPGAPLDVKGRSLFYDNYGTYTAKFLTYGDYGEVIRLGRSGVSELAGIGYPADGAISFLAGSSLEERMRILNNGNIGIGTTNPSLAKLQVSGSIFATGVDDTFIALDDQSAPRFGMVKKTGYQGMFAHSNNANFVIGMTNAATINPTGFTSLTQQFVVDTSGNVGIGITNPGTKLDISGSFRNSLATTHTLLGGAGNVVVMADNTGTLYSTSTASFIAGNSLDLWKGTKNGNIWNGDAGAGNVGIGLTNPSEKLEVSGNIKLPTNSYIQGNSAGTSANGGYIVFTGESGVNAGYGTWVNQNAIWNGTTWLQPRGALGSYLFTSNHHLGWSWRYAANGGVDGGAITPAQKMSLDSVGNLTTVGTLTVQGAGNSSFVGNVGIGLTNPSKTFQIGNSSNSASVYNDYLGSINHTIFESRDNNDGGAFMFRSNSDATTTNLMTITRFGEVGIGVTAPGTKLDVSGSLRNSLATTHSLLGGSGNVVVMADNTGTLYSTSTSSFIAGNSLDLWKGTKNGNIWNGDAGVGNVGIGTTNPLSRLDINAGDNIGLKLTAVGSSDNVGTGIRFGYNQNVLTNDYFIGKIDAIKRAGGGGDLIFNSASSAVAYNSNQLVLARNGYVGVGTSTPAYKLDVLGHIRLQGVGSNIYFDTTGASASNYIGVTNNYWTTLYTGRGSTSRLDLTEGDIRLSTNSAEQLRVSTAGNVGIGTTNPLAKLQIGVPSNATGAMSTALASYAGSLGTLTGNSINVASFAFGASNTTALGIRGYRTADGTSFNTSVIGLGMDVDNSSYTLANGMWFNSTGSIGLGTTNPGTKLDISGSFRNSLATTHSLLGGSGNVVVMADNTGTLYSTSTASFITGNSLDLWKGTKNGNIWNGDAGVGNIGIGTTNPMGKMHVVKASTLLDENQGGIVISSGVANTNAKLILGTIGDSYSYIQSMQQNVDWGTRPLILQPNNGNVGIGTTNPLVKFELSGDMLVANTNKIGFRYSAGDSGFYNYIAAPSAGPFTIAGGLWTSTPTQEAISFKTQGAAAAMSILNNGNVGIGTTAPYGKLAIVGPAATTTVALRLSKGNYADSGGHTTFIGMGAESNGWSKGAIGYTRTGSYDTGYLGFYTNNSIDSTDISASDLRMVIDKTGSVGINVTNPGTKLDISGSFRNSLATTHSLLGGAGNVVVMADNTGTLYATSSLAITGSYLPLSGGALTGNLNMGGHDILNINKLTVNTIDPLYNIKGTNYSTFASSIAGGVKEEYIGRADIKAKNLIDGEREYVIDFDNIEKGSDLWVWRQTVDFSEKNVEVLITPYGGFAQVYSSIENNKIIFKADRPVSVHYRLSGRRVDWKNWPTKANNQTEKAGFVIE